MKNLNQKGLVHYLIMGVLLVAVLGLGYYALDLRNKSLESVAVDSDISSQKALENFSKALEESESRSVGSTSSSTPRGSSTQPSNNNIAGNSDRSVEPAVSPTVTPPKTSIDSIKVFFNAIKNNDFVTANALMGPLLANEIAKIVGNEDPNLALKACSADATCSLVLNSFNPPKDNYSTTPYATANGTKGEMISFKLSDSSPIVAQQIGDYNIDVFSEEYTGNVWVIQNVYVNGSPVSNFF